MLKPASMMRFLLLAIMFGGGCGDLQTEDHASSQPGSVAEPGPSPSPFSDTLSVQYGGLQRTVLLHIPEGTPANAPLIIVIHGYSSQAASIASYSGFKELADQEKFIVAFPQGTVDAEGYTFFNVGYAFHEDVTVNDLGFIQYLVELIQTDHGASKEHVFATGMSNGGDMSFYLACEASEHFAAFAPVAGTMLQHIYQDCSPQEPRPIMAVNGTADDVTYYNGDLENRDGWGVYLDMATIVDLWRGLGELNQTEESQLPDLDATDGSTVSRTRYYSTEHRREFLLYRVENGGHDWPGVWGNMDLETTSEIWEFFSKVIDASSESR